MFPSVEAMLQAHAIDAPERELAHNGYSGARLSRIVQGDRAYVVKRVSLAENWLMRFTGDEHCREAQFAASALPGMLPSGVRAPYLGAARDGDGYAILMDDISAVQLPDDGRLAPETVDRFLQCVAELHAWGWERSFADVDISWCEISGHLTLLSPMNGQLLRNEGLDIGDAVVDGWARFDRAAPSDAIDLVRRLQAVPEPLIHILRTLPQTLIHHDLKVANAGVEGPTLWLIDWSEVTLGPVALDLAWLLTVNSSRLPWTLDAAADRYRGHLESALGSPLDVAMWDKQFAAARVCGLLMLGWGKADDPDELRWWCDGAIEAAQAMRL